RSIDRPRTAATTAPGSLNTNSAANAPTNSDITATCQPRNAPAIRSRSASPIPSASRPKPVSKSHLIDRTPSDPASAPITPLSSPIFQLPGGANSGVGPQNGHG